MPAYIGNAPWVAAYLGATPITAAYLGTTRVWSSFARQKMVKATSQNMSTGSSNTFYPVTGFAADATYPAVVEGGTNLVVVGSGDSTITVKYRWGAGSPFTFRLRAKVNGVVVWTGTARSGNGPYTESFNVHLASNDRVTLEWSRSGGAGNVALTVTDVDVAPA